MKVRVYELDENGEAVDDEMVFEGHYRDGQSYERRKHIKTLNIPCSHLGQGLFRPLGRLRYGLATVSGWRRCFAAQREIAGI